MTDEYRYFNFGIPRAHSAATAREIADNLTALAQNNFTVDEGLPHNPRNGMFRVNALDSTNVRLQMYYEGAWRTLIENIESIIGGVQRKEQEFDTLAVWIFDHNLGRFPIVQVLSDVGEVVLPEKIEHASLNRVIVTHSENQSGSIIVVG
jgi:hypothetical protein